MLYEVVLRGTFAGQEIINRWNYVRSGEPAAVSGSFALLSAMGFVKLPLDAGYPPGGLFQLLRNIQTPSMVYDEVIAREIWVVTDFYTLPFLSGEAGSVAGAAAGPIDAIGYRTNRVRQDIARGMKRFAAVPAGWIGDTGILTGGAAAIEALGEAMAADLQYTDEGNTVTFKPCVVSKEKYEVDDDPNRIAYKYYSSWALQQSHVAQGILWQSYDETRSQTSRQRGRGQ